MSKPENWEKQAGESPLDGRMTLLFWLFSQNPGRRQPCRAPVGSMGPGGQGGLKASFAEFSEIPNSKGERANFAKALSEMRLPDSQHAVAPITLRGPHWPEHSSINRWQHLAPCHSSVRRSPRTRQDDILFGGYQCAK